MALFPFLKRRTSQESLPAIRVITEPAMVSLSPEELRRELFAAAIAGDNHRLGMLGRQHRQAIHEQRLIWNGIPAPIRANPTLLRWYQDGLRTIVDCCAEWENA